jgi:hypothetical protein
MTFEPKDVPYEEVPEVDGLRATPPRTGAGESAITYLYGGGT